MKTCYSCFMTYDDAFGHCPFCGAAFCPPPKEPVYLFPGVFLANRYIIGEAIGQGGFGIVYKAWDTTLETVVAIKELFISRLATRAAGDPALSISRKAQEEFDYRKKRFLAEARTMARFGTHKNILNVLEFFEENNTAYIVMELLEGMRLNDYLASVGGVADPEFAVMIAEEVGKALISMHGERLIHRDVAPDNIFICGGKDIRIKLYDFGAAKLSDETDDYIDIILKPGYSPVEQYDNTKNIGPWSDVYALGATLYFMLTGVKPDESTNRKQEDNVVPPQMLNPAVSDTLGNAVMRAMAVERHLRYRSVEEFLKAIHGEIRVRTVEEEKKKRRTRRFSSVAAAVLVVAVVGLIIGKLWDDRVEKLDPADITVWISVREGSKEEEAMRSVIKDFREKFDDVTVELTAIPEAAYAKTIADAAAANTLPTLFESTGLPDAYLTNAQSLENVLNSKQFADCLFLDQYRQYYADDKRMPLGICIPLAEIDPNNPGLTAYDSFYFTTAADFSADTPFSASPNLPDAVKSAFGLGDHAGKEAFLEQKSAVYFTTTMDLIDKAFDQANGDGLSVRIRYVFPELDEIPCAFTYEWSIGPASEPETAAAEKLLSWMLGNVYQNMLMIGMAQDGQIPVDRECFSSKIENDGKLQPIAEIYEKFTFRQPE